MDKLVTASIDKELKTSGPKWEKHLFSVLDLITASWRLSHHFTTNRSRLELMETREKRLGLCYYEKSATFGVVGVLRETALLLLPLDRSFG